MPDLEHARMMLAMAQKDFQALQGMLDEKTFADEIFGFHAQQAVEKTLKAWLSSAGVSYPKIYDLDEIVALLENNGETVPRQFLSLLDLTDFVVQFRYEAYEFFGDWIDRPAIIQQISSLMGYVSELIDAPKNGT